MKGNRRCLKICCLVTSIIIVLLIVALVILYFTMLKPKLPQVMQTPVDLRNIEFGLFHTLTLKISLDLAIFMKNPNYAAFRYDDTMTSIYYQGVLVGQTPIEGGTIGARKTKNITSVADLQVDKIISDPHFLPDIAAGSLKFDSLVDPGGNRDLSQDLQVTCLHSYLM